MGLDILNFLEIYFEEVKQVSSRSGQYYVSPCPQCGRNKKLYVNIEDEVFHCFVCDYGRGNRISTLFKDMGANIHDYVIDDGVPFVIPKKEEQVILPPEKSLPKEYRELIGNNSVKGLQAMQYLRDRGINDSLIAYYRMGFCYDGKYNNRVILPYYEDSKLLYFVARDFTDTQTPKYLNPEWEKGSFFLNYSRVRNNSLKIAILVEGPFDIFNSPDVSLPLLGKHLSKHQIDLLKIFSKVYIALDSDTLSEESYVLAESLGKNLKNVYILPLRKYKDPGSMKQSLIEILPSAKKYVTAWQNDVNRLAQRITDIGTKKSIEKRK